MRRVAVAGVIGGLPGMLMILAPVLLHALGYITADQSQIGFVGVPLLFIGVFVGALAGAAGAGNTGWIVVGSVSGFVVGLAIGIGADAAFVALGPNIAGVWLLSTPVMMIAGAVSGYWWSERSSPPPPPPPG